ncbi:hypothetical protein VB715_05075 [Crocosphaera sp. UHCC 0190]|uniref:hypothetical protein n=1 Tax=Crocosphaera sp. UHCC 0190 TaxID=3110246 RepID=UPI002B1F7D27|nr:hypothetical protein [Crocosphaera sp. UHCC 0190]MEA5509131.1 hypothetical protein [Crocosphaera sp. UHCC 0190]
MLIHFLGVSGWLFFHFLPQQYYDNQGLPNPSIIVQASRESLEFTTLKKDLEKAGFEVIFALPPQRGAYGLLQVETKKIWINPVVFDLNISLPTLIHESVHAAQVCAGKGKITTLRLEVEPINYARPFFQQYSDIHRQDLEREAYAVQTQPNSFELALSLLQKHCNLKEKNS